MGASGRRNGEGWKPHHPSRAARRQARGCRYLAAGQRIEHLTGERKAEQEEERGGYYIRERSYGSFSRSFTLPQGTDESKIRARFEHGVLEVTVEGAAVVEEPKRIQIEGSGS